MHRLTLALLLLATACGDSPTDATGGAGGAAGAGGTGGQRVFEVGETCAAFCAKVVGECEAFEIDEPDCQQFCEQDLENEYLFETACGTAAEAVFACAAELECGAVDAWLAQSPPDGFPCQAEVAVFDSLVLARVCLPPE